LKKSKSKSENPLCAMIFELFFVALCIVMKLYTRKQRSAEFYKLIFNFMMSSTSVETRGFIFRETAVYAVWCVVHASVWPVWWVGESVSISYLPDCSHRCMYHIPYCIYTCLPADEPTWFETCRRH
jgi:hypothetical protein